FFNFINFSSNFSSLFFACSFFSISDLTNFSGALFTNDSFSNFVSNIDIYSFVSVICSFNLEISKSKSNALVVST
ncbi:MAG: hypothetical protein Q8M44_03740, partial [bacterium]|nr:hypothetical protein [bacterium]